MKNSERKATCSKKNKADVRIKEMQEKINSEGKRNVKDIRRKRTQGKGTF